MASSRRAVNKGDKRPPASNCAKAEKSSVPWPLSSQLSLLLQNWVQCSLRQRQTRHLLPRVQLQYPSFASDVMSLCDTLGKIEKSRGPLEFVLFLRCVRKSEYEVSALNRGGQQLVWIEWAFFFENECIQREDFVERLLRHSALSLQEAQATLHACQKGAPLTRGVQRLKGPTQELKEITIALEKRLCTLFLWEMLEEKAQDRQRLALLALDHPVPADPFCRGRPEGAPLLPKP